MTVQQTEVESEAYAPFMEHVEEQWRLIVQHIPDLIITVSRDGAILGINRTVEGISFGEAVGARVRDYIDRAHIDEAEKAMERTFSTGTPTRFEVLGTGPRGPSSAWYETRVIPVEREGEVSAVILLSRDVTERRATEDALERAKEQLRLSQKMEAIGRLASNIAHDFNNTLCTITGYCDIINRCLGDDELLKGKVSEIARSVERASNLTGQLLSFSRKQDVSTQALCVNDVVKEMQGMLERLLGENIELEDHLAPDLAMVNANQGQVEQVIMNLALNARDAMPDGGTLAIQTANVALVDGDRAGVADLPGGEYVMLRVSDNGRGIDGEARQRIFEPFFTTKEDGLGTGLGLSIVYGIVKQSRGDIAVTSAPGKGTDFTVFLPAVIHGHVA